ncbi:DUF1365 domain-containing protein [Chitinimonas sp.]|uniref:DUF1365 domain-containing protein n=1 Tax=Chitinimonas sp. TaxID=1934313 RepID=UPI0035B1BCD8
MDDAQLIIGQVMHERLRPLRNRFVYPVFCIRLRLAALDRLNQAWFGVNCWRPLSLRTRDYGPRDGSSLDGWMRELLNRQGIACDGDIWLQTFPRLFGYAFNPVSFWYCHGANGQLIAVLAEVSNTFGEHHRYLLTAPDGGAIVAGQLMHCRKMFHVSPFCPVAGHYQFRLRETDSSAFMGIDYHDGDGLLLRTAIGGHRQDFSPANLRRTLLRFPLMTLAVVARIHLQALRLWRARLPFFRKPAPPSHSLTLGQQTGVIP